MEKARHLSLAHLSEVIERKRMEEAERRTEEKLLFCLWCVLDWHLEELEMIRDANLPKTADEDWSPAFCDAVRRIHDVKELATEVWFAYVNAQRPQYQP